MVVRNLRDINLETRKKITNKICTYQFSQFIVRINYFQNIDFNIKPKYITIQNHTLNLQNKNKIK